MLTCAYTPALLLTAACWTVGAFRRPPRSPSSVGLPPLTVCGSPAPLVASHWDATAFRSVLLLARREVLLSVALSPAVGACVFRRVGGWGRFAPFGVASLRVASLRSVSLSSLCGVGIVLPPFGQEKNYDGGAYLSAVLPLGWLLRFTPYYSLSKKLSSPIDKTRLRV